MPKNHGGDFGRVSFVTVKDGSEECAKKYAAAVGDVALFRTFKEKQVVHSGKAASSEALKEWLLPQMVPTVFEFRGREDTKLVFKATKPTIFLLRKKFGKGLQD